MADRERVMPKYPIYVPSKGRAECCLTAQFLVHDDVPFTIVVEAPDRDAYAARFGDDRVLVLPFVNQGLHVTRTWIKDRSAAAGDARHWQLDDNISRLHRLYKAQRVRCRSGVALRATEDFVDRYENIAIAGLNYHTFATGQTRDPFFLNVHVYSATLINNAIPHSWRRIYNDDTDICLQVLADGWCTLLMNAFLAEKRATLTMKGGNADIYGSAETAEGRRRLDGRLKMSRSLQRDWPHVVQTKRRFKRAQHVVRGQWRAFDTPLKLKAEFVGKDWGAEPNEYGMELVPRDYQQWKGRPKA